MEDKSSSDPKAARNDTQKSPKTKVGQKKRAPRPREILRSMATQSPISIAELKKLVAQEYANPVISLYLSDDPKAIAPAPRSWLANFHSLKTSALAHQQNYIASLAKGARRTLDHDLEEIHAFLSESIVPTHFPSLVILRSGTDLNRVIKLDVRVPETFVIDPEPYILPLERVLESVERVLLAEVTKQETHFRLYQLGTLESLEQLRSSMPSDAVAKSEPAHEQQHHLEHLRRHLKDSSSLAERLFRDHSCTSVVLMADTRIMAMLEEHLPAALLSKVIGRIRNSPDADPRNRSDLVQQALEEYRGEKEREVLAALENYKPGDTLVSSLPNVIDVCNRFVVHTLVVSASLRERGFVCRGHHFVSLQEGTCPVDGAALLPVESVVDALVEMARLHGVKITLIDGHQDLMTKYAGIAALQYTSTAATV
jgi:peptide chain release factor subunit 1